MKNSKIEDRGSKIARAWTVSMFLLLAGGFCLLPALENKQMAMPQFSDSGVPHEQSKILADLFATAAKDVKKIVLHPPGKTASSQSFAQARAGQQLLELERIRQQLKLGTASWLSDRGNKESPLTKLAKEARKRAEAQAIEAGIRPAGGILQGSFAQIDTGAVAVIARTIYADLGGKAANSLVDRGQKIVRATAQQALDEKDINKLVAHGIILGQPTQTIKALTEDLRAVSGETVQLINVNGEPMEFDVRSYAETVVRTKTREAEQAARHERLVELGIDLVMIIGRVSDNWCTQFLGQIFSLSGNDDRYPALASLPSDPPFHPRCSKSTRAIVADLTSAKVLSLAEPTEDTQRAIAMAAEASTPQEKRAVFNTLQKQFRDTQMKQQAQARYLKIAKAA
jgi:hypothetical protein